METKEIKIAKHPFVARGNHRYLIEVDCFWSKQIRASFKPAADVNYLAVQTDPGLVATRLANGNMFMDEPVAPVLEKVVNVSQTRSSSASRGRGLNRAKNLQQLENGKCLTWNFTSSLLHISLLKYYFIKWLGTTNI